MCEVGFNQEFVGLLGIWRFWKSRFGQGVLEVAVRSLRHAFTSLHDNSTRFAFILLPSLVPGRGAAVHAGRPLPTRAAPDEWRACVRAGHPAWRAFPQSAGPRGVAGT